MTDKTEQPKVISNALLKQYLEMYQDDLQVTVLLPSGEYVGILDVSTALLTGRKLVLTMITTTDTRGKKVSPVTVA